MRLPDGRSGFGFVCMPVEMADFRNLGSQWRGLVRGVALGMAQAGLLDEDDPAVQNGEGGGVKGVLARATQRWRETWGPRLVAGWRSAGPDAGIDGRIGGVAEAAWAGRHDIVRQTAAIGVGWALLLAVWFGLAWGVMTLGVTPAYAAVTNSDLAKQALGDLLPFLGAGGTLLSQGLGTVVGALSVMACVVAALAALLSTVVMFVDTATSHDFARGKYQWTMFAIRVAVAIVLLAPFNGSWGTGSKVVGWIAAYGSEKASEAWEGMTSYLANKEKWTSKPNVGEFETTAMVISVMTAEACRAAVNLDPRRNETERVTEIVQGSELLRYDYELKHWHGWGTEAAGGCGTVVYPDTTTVTNAVGGSAAPKVLNAHRRAFANVRLTAANEVNKLIKARLACRDDPAACGPDPSDAVIRGLVASYKTEVETAIGTALQDVNAKLVQKLNAGVGGKGWIGAGQWAQTLSNLQGSLGAAENAVPRVSIPTLDSVGDGVTAVSHWLGNALIAGGNPIVKAQLAATSAQANASDDMLQALGTSLWQTLAEIPQMNPLAGLSAVGQKVWVIGVGLIVVTELVAGDGGGADDGKGIRAKLTSGIMSGVSKVATALPGPAKVVGWFADMVSSGVKAIKPVITGGAVALIVTGLGLAYLVPALPFIRFLFAVASWLMAVLEAVVLVIVALVLVVTPESGGFLGPHARSAFMNLVALFLRPILTLAGFLMGLMLCSAFVGLLNGLMLPMMREAMGGGFMFVSFVAYMLIYLGMAYILVNMATKMPDTLAVAAYRWTGANGGGGGDEGGAVGGTIGNISQSVLREVAMRLGGRGKK